jgi:hypothetical protein
MKVQSGKAKNQGGNLIQRGSMFVKAYAKIVVTYIHIKC